MSNTVSFRPRSTRDEIRGHLAAERARQSGASALGVASIAIEAQFGNAYRINNFKRRAETLIRKSFGHSDTQARFRPFILSIAEMNLDLEEACLLVRAEYALRKLQRKPLDFTDELSLILRWMRRKRMHKDFADMVCAVRAVNYSQLEAAE